MLAFLIGLGVIPATRQLAIAVGMVDSPDAHRKIHSRAIAVGGGVGVLVTASLALSLLFLRSDTWEQIALDQMTEIVGLVVGSLVVCMVGLVDDWRGLAGKTKLLGQALAAAIVVGTMKPIETLDLFGMSINLGLLSQPFAVLWILTCINAVNLIDGMDGLASSVGATIFGSIAVIGFWNEHDAEGMVALAMAGSLLAFLVYNFYPASIFLGDTGALLIGLLAGSLLLRVPSTDGQSLPILIPLGVMTIPLLDTTAAIIRRKCTGRSIYTTDRGHIHHVFRKNMKNVRWTMSCIAVLSALAGIMAIAASVIRWDLDIVAVLGILAVVGVLAGTKSFFHSELLLLSRRIRSSLGSFFVPSHRLNPDADIRLQLQGDGNWEELFEELKTTAQRLGLCRVRLDVNLPVMHEGYYAEWKVRRARSDEGIWHAVVPLVCNNRAIGRVELSGDRSENPSFQNWMSSVAELFEKVEIRVAQLIQVRASTQSKPMVVQIADDSNGHAPKMPGKLLQNTPANTGT